MATTVNSAESIAIISAYPTGVLQWVTCDISTDGAGDTSITAAAIIDKVQGASAIGKIIQVCDGGNSIIQLNGGTTGITLCCLPSSGEGNITFRSSLTGATNAAVKQITNLKLQCLIRY